jgi:hypothetical protein
MKSIYVVTMWSGGRPAKKWQSYEEPELLPTGNGVRFINTETKLSVSIIGSISVEHFETGREEIERGHRDPSRPEPVFEFPAPGDDKAV